jgi:hypothetical protein
MNFDQHVGLGILLIFVISFSNPNWITGAIIFLLIGSFIPDVIEPSKINYNSSKIMAFVYNIFPNISKGEEGYKHRAFFHSWVLFSILIIIGLISLIWFGKLAWLFYFSLGYISHLVADSISYMYNTKHFKDKNIKYYKYWGLPIK